MPHIESEKKRLVPPIPTAMDLSLLSNQEISQYYIKHPIFGSTRMRSVDDKTFWITKKYNNKNIIGKVEIEEKITAEEFESNKSYMIKPNHGIITKTRYFLTLVNNLHGELDVFHGEYEWIIFLEIEFDDIHQYSHFKKPKRVGKNISGLISNKKLFMSWPSILKKFLNPAEQHSVVKKIKKINRVAKKKLLKLNKHINQ